MSVSPCQCLELKILLLLIGIPKLIVAAIFSALTDASYQDHHTAAASTFPHMAKL